MPIQIVRMTVMSLLLALATLIAGVYIFNVMWHQQGRLSPVTWSADAIRVESGTGTVTTEGLELELGEAGRAVLALPIPPLDSDNYPSLHLGFANSPVNINLLVLWRTARLARRCMFIGPLQIYASPNG